MRPAAPYVHDGLKAVARDGARMLQQVAAEIVPSRSPALAAAGVAQEYTLQMSARPQTPIRYERPRAANTGRAAEPAPAELHAEGKQIWQESQSNLKLIDQISSLDDAGRNSFKHAFAKAFGEVGEAMKQDPSKVDQKLHKLKLLNEATECYKQGADVAPLPPGIHPFTLKQLRQDFVYNEQRQHVFDKLSEVIAHLKEAGCKRAFLGGSFVTGKELPKDFDLCWDPRGVDLTKVDPMLVNAGPFAKKEKFGGDVFHWLPELTGYDHLKGFQWDRHGESKGVVSIDLSKEP